MRPTRGLESPAQLPNLTEALLRAGVAPTTVHKILGENVLRALAAAPRRGSVKDGLPSQRVRGQKARPVVPRRPQIEDHEVPVFLRSRHVLPQHRRRLSARRIALHR